MPEYFKRNRKWLSWAIVLGLLYWAFSFYVVIPVCMPFSKSATFYLESHKKQQSEGAPKRIYFRIPSAYFNGYYPPHGGKVLSLGLHVDQFTQKPFCLMPTDIPSERELGGMTVQMKGVWKSGASNFMPSIFMRRPLLPENKIGAVGDGLIAYKYNQGEDYLALENERSVPTYFSCFRDDKGKSRYRRCNVETIYRDMWVSYAFNGSRLAEWQKIEQTAFEFIDSRISRIEK